MMRMIVMGYEIVSPVQVPLGLMDYAVTVAALLARASGLDHDTTRRALALTRLTLSADGGEARIRRALTAIRSVSAAGLLLRQRSVGHDRGILDAAEPSDRKLVTLAPTVRVPSGQRPPLSAWPLVMTSTKKT